MAKEWKRLTNRSGKKDKNTDIEIDTSNYEVDDSDKNLVDAKNEADRQNLTIDWFACYSIKDKNNNQVKEITGGYTIKFDKPDSGDKLYYYYKDNNNNGHLEYVNFSDAGTENNRQRVKATLTIGDPPIGSG
jgi:hypothetical protein